MLVPEPDLHTQMIFTLIKEVDTIQNETNNKPQHYILPNLVIELI